MYNDTFDLDQLCAYKETNRLEMTDVNNGLPITFWETYSAFSNSNGGVIVLGLKEASDGALLSTHLQNKDKLLNEFWETVNDPTKVNVNLLKYNDVNTYYLNGDVIIIYVPKADREHKPVYINNNLVNGTFRRNDKGNYRCTKSEISGMVRDQDTNYDNKCIDYMDMSVLNSETIRKFRSHNNIINYNHVWHKLPNNEYLERIGAAKIGKDDGKLHPTIAGLLMFGKEYKIRYEFPEYSLEYRSMLGQNLSLDDRLVSTSGDWSGNLVDFFFILEKKLSNGLKRPVKLAGFSNIDETDIHNSVREALLNCIINADFNFPRGIVIKKYFDKLIIENPGSIIVGKERMIKGGISEPRNRIIKKMFNLLDIGKSLGDGVPYIFNVWHDAGLLQPTIEELYNPDRTILTLPFVDQVENPSGSGEKDTLKSIAQADTLKHTAQANAGGFGEADSFEPTVQADNACGLKHADTLGTLFELKF